MYTLSSVLSYQGSVYGGRGGADRMVVGFTTTHAISAYHH